MEFNQEEQTHILFMKTILKKINDRDLPLYLKGGTSLLLCYGLDRFSEDIDLDSIKKFNLESLIYESANEIGINIEGITKPKNTDTTQRYKIKYQGRDKALKVETSFRSKEINPKEISIINDIRVYNIENIISMKIDALLGRIKSRDFYDVGYLLENYSNNFSISQKQIIFENFMNQSFIDQFLSDFETDDILNEEDFFISYDRINESIINSQDVLNIKDISNDLEIEFLTEQIREINPGYKLLSIDEFNLRLSQKLEDKEELENKYIEFLKLELNSISLNSKDKNNDEAPDNSPNI